MHTKIAAAAFAASLALPQAASAHDITSKANPKVDPAFDIVSASATADQRVARFAMEVAGTAGSVKPAAHGQLKGSKVAAYVWVTKVDASAAGFDKGAGLLALAVTAHPDFDDTPLFDENADGDPGNDGSGWHSHWVVLEADKACSAGLKVKDIKPGQDLLPATAPGLPIALDSPGFSPLVSPHQISVSAPLKGAIGQAFDAVAAELQVNSSGAAPLLCVTSVQKIASGDLSFPGKITEHK